ncbi:hypothetical protein TWF506_001543 [Arthrobotrys conoides]|uniref:Uncharacterized protein n=1 Tax=Arthrobotrys conoides TaxID=74498 RepID=A0AAN8NGB7_9PEZI
MGQREAFDGSHDATVVSNKISRYMYRYMYNMRLEGAGLNVIVNGAEGTNRYTSIRSNEVEVLRKHADIALFCIAGLVTCIPNVMLGPSAWPKLLQAGEYESG